MTYSTPASRRTIDRYTGDYSRLPLDLLRLRELDEFHVTEGEPDPRGWDLIGAGGEKLGTIEDLFVSPSTLTAYFALVNCGDWLEDRRFVVPLANIAFNEDEDKAYGPYRRDQFRSAPEYSEGGVTDFAVCCRYWSDPATVGR